MEFIGALPVLLIVAITWRCMDVYRGRQRKAMERRLATDLAALAEKRRAA